MMLKNPLLPPEIPESLFYHIPQMRAANLPGIVSLNIKELFPEIPQEIYLKGDDLSAVQRAAKDALTSVDMSMIKAEDTVNILCSEHGFGILEGKPYAEMIRTIRDVVQEKTGCENIRLKVGAGSGGEFREIIQEHGLDQYFDGKVGSLLPYKKGIAIETEIGTLYGVAGAYNADWIIHAHYDDPREIYFHRLLDRSLKSFGMSYARLETRAALHMNFGNRSATFVPRAIFNSKFVQDKFAFGCFIMTSPAGVIGVDADNDMNQLDRRITISALKSYGKVLRLFGEIDQCVMVLDGSKVHYYVQAGGVTSGNLYYAHYDFLDMRVGSLSKKIERNMNPAIKAIVINCAFAGFFLDIHTRVPMILVGQQMADMLQFDCSSPNINQNAQVAGDLEKAMEMAAQIARTDKIMIFDGSFGCINLSPSLGELLIKEAPEVSHKVDEELLPMWLRQRGIYPESV
jgi:hypothetical protein